MTKKKAEAKAEEIVSVKGFNKDFTCRGFQFEIGKTYEHTGSVIACMSGFHAIEGNPLEVFSYYSPSTSRYAEVIQNGKLARHSDDSKVASAKITIGAEIQLHEVIQRAVNWVFERAKPTDVQSNTGIRGTSSNTGIRGASSNTGTRGASSNTGIRGASSNTGDRGASSNTGYGGASSNTGTRGASSNTGDCGASSNTGIRGASSNTGDCGASSNTGIRGASSNTGYGGASSNTGIRGASSNTGDRGASSNTGTRGASSNTGDCGASSSAGLHGAAMSVGVDGSVMGAEGNALFLVFRNDDGSIAHAWAGIAGRDGIKSGIFYKLGSDGRPVECATP